MFPNLTTYANQVALYINSGKIMADELSVACRKGMKIGAYTPTLLPDFPGMPDEIPRLQIQTDKGFQLTMSPARIDLTLDLAFGLEKADDDLFFENLSLLLDVLKDYGVSYSRAGALRRFYCVMNKPELLMSECFGNAKSDGLSDFTVNAVYNATVSGLNCKDVYSLSSGIIRGVEPGLVAMRDLNVNPEQGLMTPGKLIEFVQAASVLLTDESIVGFAGAR